MQISKTKFISIAISGRENNKFNWFHWIPVFSFPLEVTRFKLIWLCFVIDYDDFSKAKYKEATK